MLRGITVHWLLTRNGMKHRYEKRNKLGRMDAMLE
jgi:hypothetical protein